MFLVVLGLVFTLHAHGGEASPEWKKALSKPLVDEWQAIFGMTVTQPGRPAETWARKMIDLQQVIVKSTGRSVPIYLSPELANTELPAIEKSEGIEVPVVHVAAGVVIRHIANLANLRMTETNSGILLELAPAKAK